MNCKLLKGEGDEHFFIMHWETKQEMLDDLRDILDALQLARETYEKEAAARELYGQI